eukprot:scaffold3035_cov111-Isochrysis_galbana.AAC.2
MGIGTPAHPAPITPPPPPTAHMTTAPPAATPATRAVPRRLAARQRRRQDRRLARVRPVGRLADAVGRHLVHLPQQLGVRRLIRDEVSVPPPRLGGGLRQPRVVRAPAGHLRVAVDIVGALPRTELLERKFDHALALAAREGDVGPHAPVADPLACDGLRSPSWASISWAAGIGGAILPTRSRIARETPRSWTKPNAYCTPREVVVRLQNPPLKLKPHVGGSTACSTTADHAPTLFLERCGVGGGGGRRAVVRQLPRCGGKGWSHIEKSTSGPCAPQTLGFGYV